MQQIRKDVYAALFVFPVTEHIQDVGDSLGDSIEAGTLEYKGYYYEGFEKVLNDNGEEELSHMQVYLRGEDAIKIHNNSKISCGRVEKQRIVTRQVYYGRDGAPVIGVLYLP